MGMPENDFDEIKSRLSSNRWKWCVTGAAGFIGSHLCEFLLKHGQEVIGVDNFATGHRENLEDVKEQVGPELSQNFHFEEMSICETEKLSAVLRGVDKVLHQGALGSVPRSFKDPLATNKANVEGFLSVLVAAKENEIKRIVYASSSSVYGDEKNLPKVEDRIGKPLSPYAVSKLSNELYSNAVHDHYGLELVGLRYFNVFGPRQDPNGAYAAVIPRWIATLIRQEAPQIFGDGKTSRDFCYIDNVVQANVLAASTENPDALNRAYNIAVCDQTSLNELFASLKVLYEKKTGETSSLEPLYKDFREGDVRHSLADISLASDLLGYQPEVKIQEGLKRTFEWFFDRQQS